jgi:hypothetical protein
MPRTDETAMLSSLNLNTGHLGPPQMDDHQAAGMYKNRNLNPTPSYSGNLPARTGAIRSDPAFLAQRNREKVDRYARNLSMKPDEYRATYPDGTTDAQIVAEVESDVAG